MKENKTIKVGSFFSGIGSPEKALKKLKQERIIDDYEVMFFSEIDKSAIKSYCTIHNINSELNWGDITKINGENLPYCDLWIGGFPCQDISYAGKMKGFEFTSSTRSSLGWEMIRLLKEVKEKPQYVIFENVASIINKKFKNTLVLFKEELINLGYKLYDDILCAINYGIPQNRTRYFLIAILNDCKTFSFPKPVFDHCILKDFLDKEVDEKYYLTYDKYEENNNTRWFTKKNLNELIYEVDIEKYKKGGLCGKDHSTKFTQSSRIYSDNGFAPTLTRSNTALNCKLVVSEEIMRIRKITPKEAWRLMGFEDKDFVAASQVCKETALYKQAGNSIVVNVLYFILKELFEK